MISHSGGHGHGGGREQRCCRRKRLYITKQFHARGTTLTRLWTYYWGIGGDLDEIALDAYLHGLGDLPPGQISLLALAIREIPAGDPLGG